MKEHRDDIYAVAATIGRTMVKSQYLTRPAAVGIYCDIRNRKEIDTCRQVDSAECQKVLDRLDNELGKLEEPQRKRIVEALEEQGDDTYYGHAYLTVTQDFVNVIETLRAAMEPATMEKCLRDKGLCPRCYRRIETTCRGWCYSGEEGNEGDEEAEEEGDKEESSKAEIDEETKEADRTIMEEVLSEAGQEIVSAAR